METLFIGVSPKDTLRKALVLPTTAKLKAQS